MPTAVDELSVFFPAHDEAANLERTVDAALTVVKGLALHDYEVIVVDDGSTDGTGAIADDLAARHAGVRVIHHDTNRGYGAALKSGLQSAAARLDLLQRRRLSSSISPRSPCCCRSPKTTMRSSAAAPSAPRASPASSTSRSGPARAGGGGSRRARRRLRVKLLRRSRSSRRCRWSPTAR